MSRRGADAGVTFLELLVALFLVTIMAALLLPTLERYRRVRELRQTARQLLADVRLAQQQAVALDENVRVVYTAGPSPEYAIEKSSDGTALKHVPVPATLTISGSFATAPLEFSPTGAPAAAGEFCLTEGTQYYRLDVAAATGRATLQEVTGCP